MKVGDIDFIESIIKSEMRISILEKIIDNILNNNSKINLPSIKEIENFKRQSFIELEKKYPRMGVKELLETQESENISLNYTSIF